MMTLRTVRDFIAGLNFTDEDHVYMGILDSKPSQAIGVYNLNRHDSWSTAIGGDELRSYGIKNISVLIHWSMDHEETETVAASLFERLRSVREETVNNVRIKFIMPLVDGPQDVGTDDSGIYEQVIEAAVVFEKGE